MSRKLTPSEMARTIDRIHSRLRACAEDAELLMQQGSTGDGWYNEAIIMLKFQLDAAKQVSAHAVRSSEAHEAGNALIDAA